MSTHKCIDFRPYSFTEKKMTQYFNKSLVLQKPFGHCFCITMLDTAESFTW